MYTATYSPEDNKLRLYASKRLDEETYARVKAAGFKWAPKQDLFVAPMWTPSREDMLLELCGEIEDEDSTMADRAEAKADRMEALSTRTAQSAQRASDAATSISSGIPLGQPILIGHHSERRARKEAEKIERNMTKAVNLWDKAGHWLERASATLAHAAYKAQPDVCYRRIKSLEADKRKHESNKQEAEKWLKLWTQCEAETDAEKQMQMALEIAAYCYLQMPRKEGDKTDFNGQQSAYGALNGSYPNLYAPRTLQEVIEVAKRIYPKTIAHQERWIQHYENRIAFERAMLGEQGGLIAEGYDIQVGGKVLVRGEWYKVLRVTKRDGKILSVRTSRRFVPVCGLDDIKGYEAPSEEEAAAAKQATKLPPIVNYPGEGFAEMTSEAYEKVPKDYKGCRKIAATETVGAHRLRCCLGHFALPNESSDKKQGYVYVFITDAKRVEPSKTTLEK